MCQDGGKDEVKRQNVFVLIFQSFWPTYMCYMQESNKKQGSSLNQKESISTVMGEDRAT